MLAGYFPGLYYAFVCYPTVQLVFGVSVTGLFITNIWLQLCHPDWGAPTAAGRRLMHSAFVVLIAFGIVPTAVFCYLYYGTVTMGIFLSCVLQVYCTVGVGAVFYATGVPESLRPGGFDIWGASHQFWHLFVSLSFYGWYNSALLVRDHMRSTGCPATASV